ncbi:uncharacterized protein LOC126313342 [Schistocerca gregaria]|uniref:uncharacterized protein LOC126313342 n=1 Tax=Schistocerca gregaria TaxID=7010 RepID=UPI00211E9529|nr:uncharacterized protein LOC126313342 [Schistocerca gregaria]
MKTVSLPLVAAGSQGPKLDIAQFSTSKTLDYTAMPQPIIMARSGLKEKIDSLSQSQKFKDKDRLKSLKESPKVYPWTIHDSAGKNVFEGYYEDIMDTCYVILSKEDNKVRVYSVENWYKFMPRAPLTQHPQEEPCSIAKLLEKRTKERKEKEERIQRRVENFLALGESVQEAPVQINAFSVHGKTVQTEKDSDDEDPDVGAEGLDFNNTFDDDEVNVGSAGEEEENVTTKKDLSKTGRNISKLVKSLFNNNEKEDEYLDEEGSSNEEENVDMNSKRRKIEEEAKEAPDSAAKKPKLDKGVKITKEHSDQKNEMLANIKAQFLVSNAHKVSDIVKLCSINIKDPIQLALFKDILQHKLERNPDKTYSMKKRPHN